MASRLAEQVPANIRAELARRGISQVDLAMHLFGRDDKTGRQRIWRRLAGRVPFSADELAATADLLGVTVASLYGDEAA